MSDTQVSLIKSNPQMQSWVKCSEWWYECDKKKRKKIENKKRRKKKCDEETADTSGEGVTLPDPQGAGVPAWERREKDRWKKRKMKVREKEGEKLVGKFRQIVELYQWFSLMLIFVVESELFLVSSEFWE